VYSEAAVNIPGRFLPASELQITRLTRRQILMVSKLQDL